MHFSAKALPLIIESIQRTSSTDGRATSRWAGDLLYLYKQNPGLMYMLQDDDEHASITAPIREAVAYETLRHRPDAWSNSIYSEASHESDAAWNELVAFRGVTLSDEEATRLNMSTLPVKNGHDTVFGFNHNIHCLRFLRQVIHSDYYYPKETDEQRAEHMFHARKPKTNPHLNLTSSFFFFSSKPDHCLETIRLSVMYVPDLTPLELYWESQRGRKWEVAARSDSQRECVKWEPLNGWMAPGHCITT
ncbi:MAG: hypothetical protein ASARMPRED_008310 [Alectoria sarmentosa]|nr:MAG: hypothetical protein ASARMPRED_008310 [Alectoria sarmentosa]